jgi:type III secretory pathway component EscR
MFIFFPINDSFSFNLYVIHSQKLVSFIKMKILMEVIRNALSLDRGNANPPIKAGIALPNNSEIIRG